MPTNDLHRQKSPTPHSVVLDPRLAPLLLRVAAAAAVPADQIATTLLVESLMDVADRMGVDFDDLSNDLLELLLGLLRASDARRSEVETG